MNREKLTLSNEPRQSALEYVTGNWQYTLQVEKFIEAARPSGLEPYSSFKTKYTGPDVRI